MVKNQNSNLGDQPAGVSHDGPPGITPDGDGPRLFNWSEDRLILLALFLLAWGSRVGLAAWMGLGQIGGPSSDTRYNYSEAVALVEGRGLVSTRPNGIAHLSAFIMPLTPLLLACGMKAFGTTEIVAQMVAISIGSLAAPLMYLVAGTIVPRRWALLAGLA